jgi:EF-P beta-lysylation protein EpmB
MIAAQPAGRQTSGSVTWQREMSEAVTDPGELLELLQLTPAQLRPAQTPESLALAARLFPLRVPRGFIARMRRGDPCDPLLRQVLPLGTEADGAAGFSLDPLAEADARRAPGLLQKYTGRALMVTTGACAVHCRYCFRRHYDYSQDHAAGGEGRWSEALNVLQQDPQVEEIILSGGDPFSLGNARLGALLAACDALPRIRRIRIHTRTPIVLPSRVDAELLRLLGSLRSELVIVVHANHAAELDPGVGLALQGLRGASRLLLNQSVLLAGINDDAATLAALSSRLFECGVLPYYLHQTDRVQGTAHFEVSDARALEIVAGVNALLPGYLVPRLVREIAGAPAKMPLIAKS